MHKCAFAARERCCQQQTSFPRAAHPRRAFCVIGNEVSYDSKKVHWTFFSYAWQHKRTLSFHNPESVLFVILLHDVFHNLSQKLCHIDRQTKDILLL